MSEELAAYEVPRTDLSMSRAPEVVLAEAKNAAHALGDVLKNKRKPVMMNGEQYLEFEDWQTVGRFYGVTAKVVSTEYVEFNGVVGFQARAVALRSDGMEISAAEAMCLNDEQNWNKKPLFQLRSMAQTRACGKALRNVLAWVVVLAGYKGTPAEEIQDMASGQRPSVQQPQERKPAPASDQALSVMTGIEQVTQKSGEKNGKPWTLCTIHAGEKYTTFDKKHAEAAKVASETGMVMVLTYTQTEKGRNLVSIAEHIDRQPGEEG